MTGVSTLGQAITQLERIKEQQTLFTTLSTQLSTGKKARFFNGLGSDVLVSKRSRADFKTVETYMDNIKNSDRRIRLMVNAIREFKEQARNLSTELVGLSQESVHQNGDIIFYDDPLTTAVENTPVGMTSANPDSEFQTLKQLAGDLVDFLKSLLNAQDEDRYILGGTDTLVKPLGSTNTLDAAISKALKDWKSGAISNDELLADLTDRTATSANPDAITDTIVGYSSVLSAGNGGKVFARISDTAEVDYTALANEDPFRNIIVAISFLTNENLGPIADAYIPPNAYPGVPDVQGAPGLTLDEMKENFFAVYGGVMQMVEESIQSIQTVEFKLENARSRLDEAKKGHEQTKNFLLNTISGVEDVDINEIAVKISGLEVSLDASYRLTAKLQELSLTNYLR